MKGHISGYGHDFTGINYDADIENTCHDFSYKRVFHSFPESSKDDWTFQLPIVIGHCHCV